MNARPQLIPEISPHHPGLVTCPMCGQVSHHHPVVLPRWRGGHKPLWVTLSSPFRKESTMYGHACETCRHMFYVTRNRMPLLHRVWVLVLAGMAGAVALLMHNIILGY